jgi:hypothetical protein
MVKGPQDLAAARRAESTPGQADHRRGGLYPGKADALVAEFVG